MFLMLISNVVFLIAFMSFMVLQLLLAHLLKLDGLILLADVFTTLSEILQSLHLPENTDYNSWSISKQSVVDIEHGMSTGAQFNSFAVLLQEKRQRVQGICSQGFVRTVEVDTAERDSRLDLSYEPFVMEGLISITGKSTEQGIEMGLITVPLHQVHLESELCTGFVKVGVHECLPVKGVDLILGNDLAGGKVFPVLEVFDKPMVCDQPDELSETVASAYHPEKTMLRKYCMDTGKEWDEGVPLVLFAVREAVQESLGFSPAELVFGHRVRGPLKMLKENILSLDSSPKVNVLDYVSKFRERLHQACSAARESLKIAKENMHSQFDRKSVQRCFQEGEACCHASPVLMAPNFESDFKLEVDASMAGAGAILLQEDKDGVDHPICYFSRKFNKHQMNYSTIEKEALALLMALQYFNVYVGSSNRPVTVFTDHNPLVFLSRSSRKASGVSESLSSSLKDNVASGLHLTPEHSEDPNCDHLVAIEVGINRKRGGGDGEDKKNTLKKAKRGEVIHETSNIVNHRKQAVLEGLPLFLREDPFALLRKCVDTSPADRQTRGMKMGILVTEDDVAPTCTNFAVVLEEAIVLKDISDLQSAVAYLSGLIFALDFQYPKELKHTFEVIEKVFMEMGTHCSAKGQSLKSKLFL
ncbi:hypothetical protein QQF64_009573 [Cirrhinus molitorella]|uniref:Reverse transcriptase RNase H-like domain-containing protein n=1 Tax=Cirrhinus molitorella TaxID=172907 RepID=A0ABR3M1I9_9TELE